MARTDLVHTPRRQRAPLVAIGRRIGSAVALVLFVAVVTRVNASGYVDATGEPIGFLDALYYASVTVTTTGYGDISAVSDGARASTVLLITPARILFLILVVGTTVEVLTDQSREFIAARRWRKRVKNHIVVCGFGATGQSAVRELRNRGLAPAEIVVVDTDGDAIDLATRLGHVAIRGDASQGAVLAQAGVREARSAIVAPNRDDTAVLITLTIREVNPGLHLVAAGREQENLHLLRQGGADEVIDTTAAVGRMLTLATTAPGAVAVLDDLLDARDGLELRELPARTGALGGQIPEGCTPVAIIRDGERHGLDHEAVETLREGDRIVVLHEAQ